MYPAQALTGFGKIMDVPVPCVSVDIQISNRSGYDLRDSDLRDVERLCEKFGKKPPEEI